MKKLAYKFLLAVLSLATATAFADEPAEIVSTQGSGEIEKVKNFIIFYTSKKYAVQVPSRVSAGDSFDIQYNKDGVLIRERFTAVNIQIRGNLCWLYSRYRSPQDTQFADTIYVQPCRRIR